MKKVIIVTMMMVSSLFAFSDSGDTGSTAQSIVRLQQRMDSLETEFHKLKIEKSDNTPGATGEIHNWGKGLYLTSHIDFLVTDAEIGYMFKLKHCRLGAGTGISLFDIIGTRTNYEINRPASWYLSFNIGTPVFLNFISLIGYEKTSLIIKNDGGRINQVAGNGIFLKAQGLGLGLGGDIEFWFKKNWSLTLGPEMELLVTSTSNSNTAFVSGTRFGLKHFF
jgi:hypothetical protein